ncbi:hypothetical protein LTR17_014777 [Elasticomyces elasticus]|nr:hypothetical protein LTR17_014777 [Elasticomyces elasticus]
MSLQELPVELLHRIYDQCDDRDIPNFRLVSRLLATVGAEHLLPEAAVHFARESFNEIEEIAKTTVAKGVRSLCFHAARLDPLPTFDDWDDQRVSANPNDQRQASGLLRIEMTRDRTPEHIRTDRSARLAKRNLSRSMNIRKGHFSRRSLLSAYKAFQRLYADQKCLKRDGTARKAFAAFFKACSRLDSVVMTMANELRVTRNKRVKAFQEAMIFPFSEEHFKYYLGVQALESLLLGAYDAGKQLRRLADLHIGLASVFDGDTEEQNEIVYERMLWDLKSGRVAEFVQAASNLTSLSITGPVSLDEDEFPNVRLCYLVGAGRWSNLTALKLRWFDCTETELDCLLANHREKLQSLELVNAHFLEGTWESFIPKIAGKFEALKTVRLRESFSSEAEGVWCNFIEFDFEAMKPEVEKGYGMFSRPHGAYVDSYTAAMEHHIRVGGEMPDPDDWDNNYDNFDMDW